MSSQPDFRKGVTYSRGPLVTGILKALWAPSVVIFLALGLYLWVRYEKEKNLTLVEIAQGIEDTQARRRWLAAFELTKRLQTTRAESDRRALLDLIRNWVARPGMLEDATLMRYVAILTGALHLPEAFPISEQLARHPSELVRVAAVGSFAQQGEQLQKNWKALVLALSDTSPNVQSQALRVLDLPQNISSVPPEVVSAVKRLTTSAALDVHWMAVLVSARFSWNSEREELLSLLDMSLPHFKQLGEPVLRDFVLRTLALLSDHREAEVRRVLENLLRDTKDRKIKRAVETVLQNFSLPT